MKIARVFPRQTSMTPRDEHSYVGEPDLFTPNDYDEAHISVAFTWDIELARDLREAWASHARKVDIGGPAYGDPGAEFEPGLYLRQGVTITMRGCPNNCDFCYVPMREGPVRELEIKPGHIVQDNNLLACSSTHIQKVFQMLKTQKGIVLSGGLESARVTDNVVEDLRGQKIERLFVAYDRSSQKSLAAKAIKRLRRVFNRRTVRCYVLIGYEGDTIERATDRLLWTWHQGAMPFAMRYCDDGHFAKIEREWSELAARYTQVKTMCVALPKETGIPV